MSSCHTMTRRFEPRPWRYTELCNRIGSCRSGPPLVQSVNADPFEDYWEDASVSLRSCHSWESPSSPWLDVSGSHPSSDEKCEDGKRFPDFPLQRNRPCRYSFDASHDILGSTRSRRNFPPPLASCSTLSIKEGGRFVLKEMDADRPQGFFRAQRGNGRLLLRLVLPDEGNEEDAGAATSDGEDDDVYNVDNNGRDVGNSSINECTDQSSLGCSQIDVGSGLDNEGLARSCHLTHISSLKESIERNGLKGAHEAVDDCNSACQRMMVDEGFVSDSTTSLGCLCGGAVETAGVGTCPASHDVSNEGTFQLLQEFQRIVTEGLNSQFQTGVHLDGSSLEGSSWGAMSLSKEGCLENMDYLSSIDLSRIVADNSYGKEQKDPPGVHQQEIMWNIDVTNHTMTSLSPWSPKQLAMHQSIVNIRPALGLAIS